VHEFLNWFNVILFY